MMRAILAGLALMAPAGCGVDGEPVRPSINTTVSAGSGGVSAGVGTGVRVGGVNLGIGLGL